MLGIGISIMSRRNPGAPPSITAPVLTWDGETEDPGPDFNVDFGPDVVEGDVIRLQYDTNNGFPSPTEATNTIDAAETTAGEIDMGLADLTNGTWYARCRVERGGGAVVSDWSNVETLTINASFSSDVLDIFAAFTTPPTAARKTAISDYVEALKTAGAWDVYDAFYEFDAADSQAALINWKSPGTFDATLTGAPTFTEDEGFDIVGATSYITAGGYNPTTAGGNWALNSAHMSLRSLTEGIAAGSDRYVGSTASSNFSHMIVRNTGDLMFSRINSGNTLNSGANAESHGHYVVTRGAADAVAHYKNGTSIATGTPAVGGITNGTMIFGNDPNFGDASYRIASASFGGFLDATQVAAFTAANQAYRDAIATFTPASFGADLILWLEADDLTTLWQEIAGSTQVASDGQTVGKWDDKSGDGFHLTAAADDTTRPVYNTTAGLHWVTFDGTNDVLRRTAALFAMGGAYTAVFAIRGNSAANAAMFGLSNSASDAAVHVWRGNSGTPSTLGEFFRNDAVGNSSINAMTVAGAFNNTDRVLGITYNNGATAAYLDGVADDTLSYTPSGVYTFNRTALGALVRTATTSWWNGRIYAGVIVNRVLDSTELAELTTYLGAKAGLTL